MLQNGTINLFHNQIFHKLGSLFFPMQSKTMIDRYYDSMVSETNEAAQNLRRINSKIEEIDPRDAVDILEIINFLNKWINKIDKLSKTLHDEDIELRNSIVDFLNQYKEFKTSIEKVVEDFEFMCMAEPVLGEAWNSPEEDCWD